jgi:hypothetical protein
MCDNADCRDCPIYMDISCAKWRQYMEDWYILGLEFRISYGDGDYAIFEKK